MKYSKEDVEFAEKTLREILKDGVTVYTVLGSVSTSGMTRHIRLFVPEKGDILNITLHTGGFLGNVQNDKGVKIGGCGMDMGFALVNDLNSKLYYNSITKEFTKKLNQRWL